MTIPRLLAIGRYWERWPPTHKMIAMYMGVKQKPKAASDADVQSFMNESQFANLR